MLSFESCSSSSSPLFLVPRAIALFQYNGILHSYFEALFDPNPKRSAQWVWLKKRVGTWLPSGFFFASSCMLVLDGPNGSAEKQWEHGPRIIERFGLEVNVKIPLFQPCSLPWAERPSRLLNTLSNMNLNTSRNGEEICLLWAVPCGLVATACWWRTVILCQWKTSCGQRKHLPWQCCDQKPRLNGFQLSFLQWSFKDVPMKFLEPDEP